MKPVKPTFINLFNIPVYSQIDNATVVSLNGEDVATLNKSFEDEEMKCLWMNEFNNIYAMVDTWL